jgi:hypothetical protein
MHKSLAIHDAYVSGDLEALKTLLDNLKIAKPTFLTKPQTWRSASAIPLTHQ